MAKKETPKEVKTETGLKLELKRQHVLNLTTEVIESGNEETVKNALVDIIDNEKNAESVISQAEKVQKLDESEFAPYRYSDGTFLYFVEKAR